MGQAGETNTHKKGANGCWRGYRCLLIPANPQASGRTKKYINDKKILVTGILHNFTHDTQAAKIKFLNVQKS